jgi:hypothetical protein
MRKTVVVAENFYEDPDTIRRYARSLDYYYPYQPEASIRSGELRPTWMTSRFRPARDCPFKCSFEILQALEAMTGEDIDMGHWSLGFPTNREGKANVTYRDGPHSCLWNCSFHVKLNTSQALGEGVHNHVTDAWNSVGPHGWAGLIYLEPDAPLDGGLKLWKNLNPRRQLDWMTPKENWELIDDLGNVYNRLLLVRGNIPHSGAAGWGENVGDGRLFQTFFFKVRSPRLHTAINASAIKRADRVHLSDEHSSPC